MQELFYFSSLPSSRSRPPICSMFSLCLPSSVTWENREVVSHCLLLGVFRETPSPASMTSTVRPSSSLDSWVSLIPARTWSSPHALFSTGWPREGGEGGQLGRRGF